MQNVIVYNKNWEKIALIDAYISLIWTKRYTAPGDFELYLPFMKRYTDIFKVGNYVSLEDDSGAGIYAMIIERVEIVQSADDGVNVTVTGRSLLSLLDRRVIYDETVLTTSCFAFISELINSCFGADALPPRRWLTDGEQAYYMNDLTADNSIRVRVAGKGKILGEVITEFCEENGIGIDILRNYNEDLYGIYVYKYPSKADSVKFAGEFDNLSECRYIQDISKYANVSRISSRESYTTAPEGADSTEFYAMTGLERFEKSYRTDLAGESDNYPALQASGIRQLRKSQNTEEITADIISNSAYSYGTDYVVGDVVTIKTDFGITAMAQLAEMTQCWDMNGYSQIPTFSNYIIIS